MRFGQGFQRSATRMETMIEQKPRWLMPLTGLRMRPDVRRGRSASISWKGSGRCSGRWTMTGWTRRMVVEGRKNVFVVEQWRQS